MDLRLLRYFLAIVHTGSVTGASKELFVAQPSLSRQLRRLEDELGFALFDRSERRLSLTAAGRAFLPVAADLVNRAAQAAAMARGISQGANEELVISAAPTTINDIIAPYIVSGPDCVLDRQRRRAVPGRGVRRGARRRRRPRRRAPGCRRPTSSTGWWAGCRCGRSARRTIRSPSTTRSPSRSWWTWPLIVMQDSHAVRRLFDDAVVQAGHGYATALETKSSTVAQALAATGKGVCVTSDDARFGLRELPIRAGDVELTLTIYAAWDGTHYAVEADRARRRGAGRLHRRALRGAVAALTTERDPRVALREQSVVR